MFAYWVPVASQKRVKVAAGSLHCNEPCMACLNLSSGYRRQDQEATGNVASSSRSVVGQVRQPGARPQQQAMSDSGRSSQSEVGRVRPGCMLALPKTLPLRSCSETMRVLQSACVTACVQAVLHVLEFAAQTHSQACKVCYSGYEGKEAAA